MAQQTLEQAGAITEAVRTRGEAGFVEFSVRFGDLKSASDPYMVTKEEMEAAFNALPVSEQELLTRTAARIRHFATEQRNSIQDMRTDIVGGHGGHWVSAVDIAGCYAPGGRYPLPSSVLMTAITARVAGVKVRFLDLRPLSSTRDNRNIGAFFPNAAHGVNLSVDLRSLVSAL